MNRKPIILIAVSVIVLIGFMIATRSFILGGATPVDTGGSSLQEETKSVAQEPTEAELFTDISSEGVNIDSTEYSKDKQWALLLITPTKIGTADPAYVLMKQQRDGSYMTVLGPGTNFEESILQEAGTPKELVNRLDEEGMVNHPSPEGEFEEGILHYD